ncbi:MAG: HD-GYP domain-containing protein [Deltaproteobacteria bacterium]|nr:HD-GYP domain-containing protein [Deltaproteobacteria bacterium]
MSGDKDLILQAINAALQSKKLYPPGHPSIAAPAKRSFQLVSTALITRRKLPIGIVDDSLVFEDIPIHDGENRYEDLYQVMKTNLVESIIIEKGVKEIELSNVLELLSNDEVLTGSEMKSELQKLRVKHITIKVPEEKRGMIEIYNGALDVVKDVMGDIRMGKIPDSTAVSDMVEEMEKKVLSDTNAMVGLTMIKNYDDYLYTHSVNVSIISMALGRHMKLPKDQLRALGVGSLLHDVGKTGVSEDIIKKPGGLSAEEFEKIKEHPVFGGKITSRMKEIDKAVVHIVSEHHVKYDHSGYPNLDGEIHPLSHIVSIADTYDALTTLRVYQNPRQPVDAIKIIKDLIGKHFAPEPANAFIDMVGFFPIGTLIRLSNNEIGVVIGITLGKNERPEVRILYDGEGTRLGNDKIVNLIDEQHSKVNVIGSVDPLSKGLDIGEIMKKNVIEVEEEQEKKSA